MMSRVSKDRNKTECLKLILENQSKENMLKLKRLIYTPDETIPTRDSSETGQQFVDRLYECYLEGRLTPNGMRKAFGLEPI